MRLNKRYIYVLSALCLCLQTAMATAGEKDSLLTIPFGKNNQIRYYLMSGTYDVVFNGRLVITGAYATYKGKQEIESRGAGPGKYSTSLLRSMHGKGILYRIECMRGDLRMQQLFYIYPG